MLNRGRFKCQYFILLVMQNTRPKKKGTGDSKNFGPVQSIKMPNFAGIKKQYDNLQQQYMENPAAAKKMRTMGKSSPSKPSQAQGYEETYGQPDYVEEAEEQPQFEEEKKEEDLEMTAQTGAQSKVVNPWIHKATHNEYLEQVKGLPARHANVIRKHKNVVKEKTFLNEDTANKEKDANTQEALKILEKEYEIFTDPNLPNTRALTRFDTWDEDRTPQEWLQWCSARPDRPHALSPVFDNGQYLWKPVEVHDYVTEQKKYKVKVLSTGQVKLVTRLSLLFFDEDPELFRKRVNNCKELQAQVEAELRFTDLVDSIPADQVSILSKERRHNCLNKCVRASDKFDPDRVYATFKHLMRVVEEEYIRQMKKCIVLREMQDPSKAEKFEKLKIPIRLPQRTAPYFGVVKFNKEQSFKDNKNQISQLHQSADADLAGLSNTFTAKCLEFLEQRYLNTKKSVLKLPSELKDLRKRENEHHSTIAKSLQGKWRGLLVEEIKDVLSNTHDFNEQDPAVYAKSSLKALITRFELILNSYLREFVKLSIDDWVQFIKSFTYPNRKEGELWEVSDVPMIVIHLHFRIPDEKDKKDKDKKKKKKEGEEEEEEEKEGKGIVFKPSLEKVSEFLTSGLDQIVESTNQVHMLEQGVMHLLEFKEGDPRGQPRPCFELSHDFPWIQEAQETIKKLVTQNMVEPAQLLEKYQHYTEILNVSKTQLKKDLFGDSKSEDQDEAKAPLEKLRETIGHYDTAYYEILNLSNDVMDFPLVRVMAGNLKKKLADKCFQIRESLLEAVLTWCKNKTGHISQQYRNISETVKKHIRSEQDLVDTQEFIKTNPERMHQLKLLWDEIADHYGLLEDFAYGGEGDGKDDEDDIGAFWDLRAEPGDIETDITDQNNIIEKQKEDFMAKLDNEKEQFHKTIEQHKEKFNKIRTFSDLNTIDDFYTDASQLKEDLDEAFRKVEEFNYREKLFQIQPTKYEQLDQLQVDFNPFWELIETAYEKTYDFKEWETTGLFQQNSQNISSKVQKWHSASFRLYKVLEADYPDTASAAQELRNSIEEFQKNLPLITSLLSPANGSDEWTAIRELLPKLEDTFGSPEDNTSLLQLLEMGAMEHIEDIEIICHKAEKKYQLGENLTRMKAEMRETKLTLFQYKKTHVLKAYDEINAVLDEQNVQTQAIANSQYCSGKLKSETTTWDRKLNELSEIIDEICKCQKTWMYLEPIFSSDDIEQQMPNEAGSFREVDDIWKQTMLAIEQDSTITMLLEQEGLKQLFITSNKKLDEIQSKLNDYLEEKRDVFSRFYFLANEDLLMLLAQTKDPRAVQPHMDKCFEGIQKVIFTAQDEVSGMVSAEGEEVMFDTMVDVNEGDKKGNVEKWMLEIEGVMRKSLRRIMRDSVADYAKSKRTDWVTAWPGQIILACNQVYWTKEVEQAIKDVAHGGLENSVKQQNKQIEGVVNLVRGKLPAQTRITLKAMVVIDVHARNVTEQLITKGVQTYQDFEWTSQLRYYWDEKDPLRVEMVTAIIPYGYEYLGNSPRLVITSLTDRCYRTLLGAKHLNYGGAPEGPAGTGKTESVKDLAKAIAVQCVVFNCSDGLDFMAMAKFFKGLATSGAWCCFDEFNRIDLEVLSVIAQQILTIQNAIRLKKRKFEFDGKELMLNRSCAVNITMNPGYAGRSELPDNLKALFRPCAMMVPDYKLIAEIELYSFGFKEADDLARKVVASLRLSSEQLSSQGHYDFGMRALKAILTACGNLRRVLDQPEEHIGLRALMDVNIPKFTSNDIPLFLGITSDLFPGVVLEKPDYTLIQEGMVGACAQLKLQPKEEYLHKCIQLYETICVRHGLMVVGKSFSGKSMVIKILAKAMSSIKDNPDFQNVLSYFVNPKSITQNQLYGWSDPDSGEWSDGVLAIKIRDAAESETPDRKWVIFDGPVDAVWIENMNTVLDDNKKLCLNSGQIIKLKPTMTIMFEVEDLAEASPATVSRCGMVFMEPKILGFKPLIDSYCDSLTELMPKLAPTLREWMHWFAGVSICFVMEYGKFPVATDANFLINSMLNLFECNVKQYRPEAGEEVNPNKLPKEIDEIVNQALLFAVIWSLGGALDEHSRPKFNEFLKELIGSEDVVAKYKLDFEEHTPKKFPAKLGEYNSLFDMYYDKNKLMWVNWVKTLPQAYQVPKEASFSEVIVPTSDSIRTSLLMKFIVEKGFHPLFCGPTGTGKTIGIETELKQSFDDEKYIYYSLSFSAQTSANQTQKIIDGKMDKRRKGVYGPKAGKNGIIFVDDLNMPQKEKYGAQPPIELLRQWMDYGGWYEIDTPEKAFRYLEGVKFVAAMGPPGGGRNTITARYVRHFVSIYVEPFSHDSMMYIFNNVLEWMFQSNQSPMFSKGVTSLKENLVNSTLVLYNLVMERFKPTPAKSHYTYNLRDVSKVFQGISKGSPKAIQKDNDMIKLWMHEATRVFSDRLISIQDRSLFAALLQEILKDKFKKDFNKIVEVQPLLFASFVPLVYPDNDETKRPLRDLYCELTNREKVQKEVQDGLSSYNTRNASKKMNLVLFGDAVEHLVKIHRVITTEKGNALLVGVGGSGRKSLTALAGSMANYDSFSIELSKAYNFGAWRDDMRKLYEMCGLNQNGATVFQLSDTQIINEAFLEDVNNVLNGGSIPNLYTNNEDIDSIKEGVKEMAKLDPGIKALVEADPFEYFLNLCKKNLHIVLTMSPIGEDFKRRLRMFPSLVNCCTIDWFLPWPKEALESVAHQFLADTELEHKEGIINICVDMQQRVQDLSKRFYEELRSHYYVTPTSYLELIKTFQKLLGKKRMEVDKVINKFQKGLTQLSMAEQEVAELKKKAEELQPLVEQKAEETKLLMKDIEVKKKSVAEETEAVKKEEDMAKEEKNKADIIKKDCEEELARVQPILDNAEKAARSLNSAAITEIKGFKKPPPAVKLVVESLCYIFKVNPDKKRDGKEVIYDYWEPAQKKVLTGDLQNNLKKFAKGSGFDQEIIDKLKPIIAKDDYSDTTLKRVSQAALSMAAWVKAMVQFDEAMKVVNPKKAALQEAQEKSAAAQKIWDAALERLRAVEAEMAKLISDFEAAKAEEERLKNQKDDCVRKCNRAQDLTGKLANEKENWAEEKKRQEAFRLNIVGDILICSGIIAYLGVFLKDYREDCIKSWKEMMDQYEIKSSENLTLEGVMGDALRINSYLLQKLPNDAISKENAIIMENSERWPLMIDPQMQGNAWIRNKEKENGAVFIKPTLEPKKLETMLKLCVQQGTPMIFEDAGESFDPMLEPLLGKQFEGKGQHFTVKVGDEAVSYDKDFRMYITTKLSKPHYPPEICVKVTMLNFKVNKDGLQEQMIMILVKHEEENKFQRYMTNVEKQSKNQIEMAELQDGILSRIADSEGDILEDEDLFQKLNESSKKVELMKQEEAGMKQMKDAIDKVKDTFEPVALRVSNLFFVIADLMTVDPMYQYSLDFFTDIYNKALKKADEKGIEKSEKAQRRAFYISKFTSLLYKNVCRSLFEKDKLLFSFLMCNKIMEERGELSNLEARFLMAGPTAVSAPRPNPTGENGWLLDKQWAHICELAENYPFYKGFDRDLEENLGAWEKISVSTTPEADEWPGKWNEVPIFNKMLILRVLRPDKVIPGIRSLISAEVDLGSKYIKPPPFDLVKSYKDSTNKTPIIIVISAGADPMSELQKLAHKMKIKISSLSLGQGQSEKARMQIQKAQEAHEWVVLQNCHLAPSFMPILDATLEEIEYNPDTNFRIWLTTMPSDKFPVSIVQNGVKTTIEPPKGLRNNLLRSYLALDDQEMESCEKPTAYKRLMFCLCFFNALIIERRKFGPLGWNIPYEFSASDLKISQSQLKMFLDEYKDIPFEALRYMVAEANYGGRVTDPKDRRCIATLLETYYNPAVLKKDNYKYCESGAYYVPSDGAIEEYVEFVKEMPIADLTEVFGLHNNADITSAINDTNSLLSTALSMLPRTAGGAGKSQEDSLKEIAKSLLDKLPQPLDTEKAAKLHPIMYEESMNTVLAQELLRFNRLLGVVRSSLINLGKAIKGEVVLSLELETMGNSLYDNRVPALWEAKSYPSLKPLASWIIDFLARLKFMQDWIDNGAPANFWISGFFFTQSFLTGVKQNYARRLKLAIDGIDWDFRVVCPQHNIDVEKPPEHGAYIHGTFVEGCRWDQDNEVLEESEHKVLFTQMNFIHIVPIQVTKFEHGHRYVCPLYKTSRRAGTLSTTGHSTNFVIDILLPMKQEHQEAHWIGRGVAMLTQLSD